MRGNHLIQRNMKKICFSLETVRVPRVYASLVSQISAAKFVVRQLTQKLPKIPSPKEEAIFISETKQKQAESEFTINCLTESIFAVKILIVVF